ncbi:efflux RND transporter periplasmic adaptor subunit [Hydrogenophaga borbori]|uniref:efflux RND transporter periplasmic adaptor subunit n=1 Tax=Hydrogenophaga sp. PBC TaxID=795665 RepID=UPI0002607BDF|nr:efflux RND transporter periplasmic adaptor subunit [Hydrogenophaga sp. PBC]AOS78026.1 efflux transporter periplasmic adaptor subunit [Hydrogenophaga sp. PBC]
MNKNHLIALLIAAGVLGAAGYGLYALGMKNGSRMTAVTAPAGSAPTPVAAPAAEPQSIAEGEEATRRHISAGLKAGDTDPVSGRKILYYHDPMVPGNRFDRPAKSPFMDMMLVPVYADGGSDQGTVTISPRIQQSLGVRTAAVTEGTLSPQVSAVGNIAFNERDQATVQARATGYVERLHVRATLDSVAKGQPLLDLYVPDWVAAQEEFLALKRMQGNDLGSLVDGARQRMRQAGMSEQQIQLVETSGKAQARTTVTAPLGGVVVELVVREGMTVAAGTTLFRINGLSTVWANAEVPESQAALLRPEAKVQARSPAVPGSVFEGKVQAILPDVNAATRTLKARLELANPGSRLVPGMFVSMQFMDMRAEQALLVPTEAVIQTGKRTVVMLAEDDGRFRPVDVEAGVESGGQTEIKRGLQVGQRVVVSSQFLIDSEASLKGVEARLNNEANPSLVRHPGEARVIAIDQHSALLAHGPLPTAGMGAMTMPFKAPAGGMPSNVAKGDRVRFEFVMPKDGEPTLTSIQPVAPVAPAPGAQR